MKWTEEQQSAIFGRAPQLLVSAAAGSGKTAVLVERIFSRLTDPQNPAEITDFLIVTFTNAAAAEMRARLLKRLGAALQETPTDRRLRRQMALVPQAQIATVHAFCLSLLRDHGHTLGLSGDFRLAIDDEGDALLEETVEELLEETYAKEDPIFEDLINAISPERDDSRLAELLIRIYLRLENMPNRAQYLAQQRKEQPIPSSVGQTLWGRAHLQRRGEEAAFCLRGHGRALDLLEPFLSDPEYGKIANSAAGVFNVEKECISQLREALLGEDWNSARRSLQNLLTLSTRLSVKKLPEDTARELTALRKSFQDWKKSLKTDILLYEEDTVLGGFRHSFPLASRFFELLEHLCQLFAEKKAQANLLDFADLEHLALQLLAREDGDGVFRPTPLARALDQGFVEVMVDEYQDINAMQDTIFQMITADHASLFMVGDVKQSIYRFRNADPTIFLRRKNSATPLPTTHQGDGPCVVSLSRNFRSSQEVIDAVNQVFALLMQREIAEMDYPVEDRLVCGRESEPDAACTTEVLALTMPEDSDTLSLSKMEAEANLLANRILELVGHATLGDGEHRRPCEFGDIAILLRSMKNKAPLIANTLRGRGIPVDTDTGGSFFDAPEVSAVLSLLTLVDNPASDVDLVGVLSSPLFNFTLSELAQIRSSNRSAPTFFDAFCACGQEATPLGAKCAAFLSTLHQWREQCLDLAIGDQVSFLLEACGAETVFSAGENSETRLSNIRQISVLAENYKSRGDLSQFLASLRRLEAKNKDISATHAAGNGVHLMSIHSSKGLEFPIVFLPCLSDQLNNQISREQVNFHPELGLGFRQPSGVPGVFTESLIRTVIREHYKDEQLAEELRILYVAMTRAREKLIVTLRRERDFVPPAFDDLRDLAQYCRNKRSIGSWLEGVLGYGNHTGHFRIIPVEGEADSRQTVVTDRSATADPALVQTIRERLAWKYPYGNAMEPAKLTATIYKKLLSPHWEPDWGSFPSPQFLQASQGLRGAERGLATHLAMQLLPLQAYSTVEQVAQEVQLLLQRKQITPAQAEAISCDRILSFYRSKLGQELLSVPAERIRREFKFSLLTDPRRYLPDATEKEILLQGVIDLYFEGEDGTLCVVDFKTDRVSPAGLPERVEAYRPQLALYGDALTEITGRTVARKYLFFLETGQAISL